MGFFHLSLKISEILFLESLQANITSSSESEELLEESELDEEEDEYLTKHKTIKACEMQEFFSFIKSLKYLTK